MDVGTAANWVQIIDYAIPILIGILTFFGRRWLKRELHAMGIKVEQRTSPIQSTANGGLSLPDVAKRLAAMDDKADSRHLLLAERMEAFGSKIDAIGREVSHLTGRFEEHVDSGRAKHGLDIR